MAKDRSSAHCVCVRRISENYFRNPHHPTDLLDRVDILLLGTVRRISAVISLNTDEDEGRLCSMNSIEVLWAVTAWRARRLRNDVRVVSYLCAC